MQKIKPILGTLFIVLLISCTKENTSEQNLQDTSPAIVHYEFANNLNDISGNSFNGISDTAIDFVPDRFSRINQAIRFNGPLHKSYFLLPTMSNKQVSNRFTVSFWFTITTANSSNLFFKSDYKNGTESGISVAAVNGKLKVILGDSTNTREFLANTPINQNSWKHVAVTADSNDIKIYFNGQLYNSQMSIINSGNFTATAFKGNADLAVGLLGGLQPYPLTDGKLDDFRIYKRAISAAEVTVIYNYQP